MSLWLIRHGGSAWIVRARAREEALAFIFGSETSETPEVVLELSHEGESAIMWSYPLWPVDESQVSDE